MRGFSIHISTAVGVNWHNPLCSHDSLSVGAALIFDIFRKKNNIYQMLNLIELNYRRLGLWVEN